MFDPILSALLNERPQSSFTLNGPQEDVVNTGSLSSWHVYTKLEHYSTFLFVSIDSRNLPVSQGIGRIGYDFFCVGVIFCAREVRVWAWRLSVLIITVQPCLCWIRKIQRIGIQACSYFNFPTLRHECRSFFPSTKHFKRTKWRIIYNKIEINHFYYTLVQIVHRVENTLDTNLVAVSPSFQTCKKQNLPRLYHCYVCTIVNQIRQVIVNLPRNMAHC